MTISTQKRVRKLKGIEGSVAILAQAVWLEHYGLFHPRLGASYRAAATPSLPCLGSARPGGAYSWSDQ